MTIKHIVSAKSKVQQVITLLMAALTIVAGSCFIYPYYKEYAKNQWLAQQHKDLISPIARIKVRVNIPGQEARLGTGSGVTVYSELNELGTGFDTYVLTCNHVVEVPIYQKGEEIQTPFGPMIEYKVIGSEYAVEYIEYFDASGNSRKIMGHVIAHTPNNSFGIDADGNMVLEETNQKAGDDLALIKLDTSEHFPTVKMMTKKKFQGLQTLESAYLVGCALGDKPIMTGGEITRLENGWFSTNANMIFGNSGGAAFLSETNEFIGITNAIRVAGMQAVPYIGMIRPLDRIYDWLDTNNYSFIYSKNVADTKRFNIIRQESDNYKLNNREYTRNFEKQLKQLQDLINKTQDQLKESQNKTDNLEGCLNESQNKINELEKQLKQLQEQIAKQKQMESQKEEGHQVREINPCLLIPPINIHNN